MLSETEQNSKRNTIFEKDYLDIHDLQFILGLSYQMAARKLREIKHQSDRLRIQGKIHTEDYFDYFNITDKQRYLQNFITKREEQK